MSTLDIYGAYGRNYATADAARLDWTDGKDFKVLGGGPYLSIQDADKMLADGFTRVCIWYGYPGSPKGWLGERLTIDLVKAFSLIKPKAEKPETVKAKKGARK